jgi:hypothetical protein
MATLLLTMSAAVHNLDDSNARFSCEVEWKVDAFEPPQPSR